MTAALCAVLANCEGIDCTLNNVVTLNIGFYDSETGDEYNLPDTLTITTEGTDSILLNQAYAIKEATLPMSYWQEADTLHFTFTNADEWHEVILRIQKTNTPRFESPDCPTTMHHTIESVTIISNTSQYIDSVVVATNAVDYAQQENLKIYFHTAD